MYNTPQKPQSTPIGSRSKDGEKHSRRLAFVIKLMGSPTIHPDLQPPDFADCNARILKYPMYSQLIPQFNPIPIHPKSHRADQSMSTSWHTLPTEMQLQVVGNLDVADARTFSAVDQRTYAACVPVLFRVGFFVKQCRSGP